MGSQLGQSPGNQLGGQAGPPGGQAAAPGLPDLLKLLMMAPPPPPNVGAGYGQGPEGRFFQPSILNLFD